MDVSVVLPTWNRSSDGRHLGFLEECLSSLYEQEFTGKWELLIGTELPQRNGRMSLDVIEMFRPEFKRIGVDLKVLIGDADENSGHGPTDNDLYALARGKYVTRPLGDDELYSPEMLQTLFDAMEGSPGSVLAYSDFEDIDADGKVLRERVRGKYTHDRIQKECFIGICVLLHRDSLIGAKLEWSAIKAGEDWDMWKRMSERFFEDQFVHVPEFLGQWRDWGGTLTQSVRDGDIEAGKDYTA